MPAGNFQNPVHVGRLSVQVDGYDRPGPRSDGSLQQARIQRVRSRVDIHEHRGGARIMDRGYRGHEGERRGDDLMAWPDARGQQRQVQSAGPRVHSDRLTPTRTGGELLFEGRHFLAQNELAALQNVRDGPIDFRLDAVVLRLQVQIGDHHATAGKFHVVYALS